ncbi:protein TolQ [Parvibaculaceae bacterium PLY_AMNH_Bact1]|nr:protein TolQ [Parvibaculaceae bacterium PLY_AMNH_Bact1]
MVTDATDFTLWSLFARADWVVKSVMIGLIGASIWSWAIMFDKWWRLSSVRRKADSFETTFWSGRSLDDLYQDLGSRPNHPMSSLFAAAMREWKRSSEAGPNHFAGVKERVDRVMSVTLNKEMVSLETNLLFLATVGSIAPFVGLFGTVWGIMNSFQSIAISRDTNLAVVAPGIAEALFATALGLLAAIPAVIAYNKFSSEIGRFGSRLEGFADEFSAIVSRQVDDRR